MKQILRNIFVALCFISQSGCLCVETVKHIGVHETQLTPTSFFTNTCGDVVLECKVSDIHRATSASRDIGTRYIYASRSTWDATVSRSTGTNIYGKRIPVYLEPIVMCSSNNTLPAADGFWLIPGDVKHWLIAQPPEECEPWSPAAADNAQHSSCPRYSASIGSQPVEVIICSAKVSRAQYKTRWWKPAQILQVPAYAVDILTFPIQFIIIMHELSTIGG